MLCVQFVEYLIDTKAEERSEFHDRLAELYLRLTMEAKKRGDEGTCELTLALSRLALKMEGMCRYTASYEGEAFAFH